MCDFYGHVLHTERTLYVLQDAQWFGRKAVNIMRIMRYLDNALV